MAALAPASPVDRSFFGQPRGLAVLFLTEMWERFSFYGMRALLVLYLVAPTNEASPPGPGMGISTGDAFAIYGSYNALVYLTPLAGGWVADKLWGARRSVLVGAIIIACGHFSMATRVDLLFWLGLLLIASGTGLLKPNISAIVGDLYGPGDERRDAGFSLFYMGINLGAFLAPIVCGFLQLRYGWHVGFIAAGVGMVLGIVVYLVGQRWLGRSGVAPGAPATPSERRRGLQIGIGAIVVAAGAVAFDAIFLGFQITDLTVMLTVVVLVLPVVYFTRILRAPITAVERSRVKAFILLFIAAAVFWGIYDQAGSTLSVFAEQYTNRDLFGMEIPAATFQSINPIFIIIFAPIFAWMWMKLADRAPTLGLKFAIAMFGIGLSFVIMIVPAMAADDGKLSSAWWLVSVYLVQTWAELLLSPTGLSATTQLAPAGFGSQMLALWFLAVSVGDSVAGQVLRALDGKPLTTQFAVFAASALVMAAIMLFLVKPLRRLMEGVR